MTSSRTFVHAVDVVPQMRVPSAERASVKSKHPHPRSDPAYAALDENERYFNDYRFTFDESFMNRDFLRLLHEEGAAGPVYLYPMASVGVSVVLLVLYLAAQVIPTSIPFLSLLVTFYAGVPFPVMLGFCGVVSVIVAYPLLKFGWRKAFDEVMSPVLIDVGRKLAVTTYYPESRLGNRADRYSTGEYVLTLPKCCEDSPDCDCPIPNIYEADIENAIPAAEPATMSAARELYTTAMSSDKLGSELPLGLPKEGELLKKAMPLVLMMAAFFIIGFLIMTQEPEASSTPNPGNETEQAAAGGPESVADPGDETGEDGLDEVPEDDGAGAGHDEPDELPTRTKGPYAPVIGQQEESPEAE